MISLYKSAWRCVAANPVIYLVLAAGFLLVDVFAAGKNGGIGITLVLWASIIFMLHQHFLFGGKLGTAKVNGKPRAIAPLGFLALILAFLAPAIVIAIALAIHFDIFNSDKATRNGFVMLAMLPLYLVTLCLFGSAIPAYVAGDRYGFGATIARIKTTALSILGGLLIGPTLWSVVVLGRALVIVPKAHLPQDVLDATGHFSPVGTLVSGVERLSGLFSSTLAVAVLCRAYRKTAPAA